MFIKAETCALRSLEPQDADILYLWENNRELWSYSNTLVPFSKFILQQFVDAAQQDIYTNKQLRLMVFKPQENETIGCVDIFDLDPFHLRCGIGVYIHQDYRGEGYALEALNMITDYAFSSLMLTQVYAEVSEQNVASLKLFEKAGFEQTGKKLNWHRTSENTFEHVVLLQLAAPKI